MASTTDHRMLIALGLIWPRTKDALSGVSPTTLPRGGWNSKHGTAHPAAHLVREGGYLIARDSGYWVVLIRVSVWSTLGGSKISITRYVLDEAAALRALTTGKAPPPEDLAPIKEGTP